MFWLWRKRFSGHSSVIPFEAAAHGIDLADSTSMPTPIVLTLQTLEPALLA
jgi:hypothetical protein